MSSGTQDADGSGATPGEATAPRASFWYEWVKPFALVLAAIVIFAFLATLALPAPGLPPTLPQHVSPNGVATVQASIRYEAGAVRRALLGSGYRQLWATPIQVPVLDLSAIAGGLSPVRTGGGRQTRSLRLRGDDGGEYVFRSIDKDQATGLSWFRRTTLGRIRQDQVSALHPGAAPVVARLAGTAGVRQPQPVLTVMPDTERLGEFRDEFGGMLGILEVRLAEGATRTPGFAGADRIFDMEELWAHLETHSEERIDVRAYLAARLLDVLVGDWDRHEDQLRWARFGVAGDRVWVPIPRDRDYAFSNYEGLVPRLARIVDPKVVRFDSDYRDLRGLLTKSRELDRRLLCPLPTAAWDSAAASLRDSLSDPAIDEAVGSMPAEYLPIAGSSLAMTLRARRNRLPAMATRFRRYVEVSGCDLGVDHDHQPDHRREL